MSHRPPRHESFPVSDGSLAALSFGSAEPAAPTVLALHGITASAMSWAAVAAALPGSWRMVALDLRGRGRSRDLPGPTGLLRHAADVCQVADRLHADDLVLAGHSMGAYVALLAASSRPELFSRVVLVDGGIALALPAGADPDEVLARTLGPALARLTQTFTDVEDYLELFRRHPALGPHWNQVVEDYVRYDALETSEGVRSRAVESAVRTDGRDVLVGAEEFDSALMGLPLPVHLLTAPSGMFGEPPGLLPEDAVAATAARAQHLVVEEVPGANHYTLLFDPSAAAHVAAAVTDRAPAPTGRSRAQSV